MVPGSMLTRGEQVMQENAANASPSGRHAATSGQKRQTNKARTQVQIERPNIFVLYEQNIGLLTPLIANELEDAAERYPADWIEAAFLEAVQYNKRKWSYIRAILRSWEKDGRQQAWNA